MFESVSLLGVTLALFWAVVGSIAVIMLAGDIHREWEFRRAYRKAPEIVNGWVKYRGAFDPYEPKIGDDYDPRKDVYDWKKEAPNDFS